MRTVDLVIEQGWTLEGVAARFLGDGARWSEIVRLNRLRYPYLSDDPRERQGPALGQSQLRAVTVSLGADSGGAAGTTTDLVAGSVLLPLLTDLTVVPGQLAMLVRLGIGGPSWEVHPLVGMTHPTSPAVVAASALGPPPRGPQPPGSAATSLIDASVQAAYAPEVIAAFPAPPVLVLTEGLTQRWPAGALVTIHGDPREQRGFVLGPGDHLRLPLTPLDAPLIPPASEAQLFGVDLALDGDGQLGWDDAGALVLAAGLANLEQALRNRLLTPTGALPMHPEYGDRVLDRLGQVYPESLLLAAFDLADALRAEPRVGAVTDARASLAADTLIADATVQIAGTQTLLAIQAIIRR